MIKIIGLILMGVGIGIIFTYLRGKIINKIKDKIEEKWDTGKFLDGITNLTSGHKWGQTLSWWLNFRNWIVVLAIVGVVYGAGVYRGKLGKPVNVPLKYESEYNFKLDSQWLKKPKDSYRFEVWDNDCKTKLKDVTVGDVKELRKALKPYGVILSPYFSTGGAIIEGKIKQDTGFGIHFLKFFKWRAGVELTNNGGEIGVDYRITDNFGVGGRIGKTYKGKDLTALKGWWNF